MRVPPFLWVDLDTVELHGEVDMIASGHAGLAAQSHDLALFHQVAFVDIDLAEVAIDGLQSVSMVDEDAVAIDAQRRGVDDLSIVGCLHADVLRYGQVVSEVNLLVDFISVVDVVPQVRKACFGLRMRLPDEGSRP